MTAKVAAARNAAVVLGSGLGLACGFPGLYFGSLPIFLKPISTSFHWDRASTSAVSVASLVGLTVASPMAGWMMDRFGSRNVIATSIVLFSSGVFAFSILPNSLLLFALASFATGSLGVATGPNGYAVVLSRSFDRRLGLALSLAMVGGGVGVAIMPIVAQSLIVAADWRHAYRGLSVIALVAGGLALALIVSGPKREPAARLSLSTEEGAGLPGDSLALAVRGRRFWTLFFLAVVVAACGLGTSVHMPSLLNDRGMPSIDVARVTAAIGVGVVAGRLLCGALMDFVWAPLVCALLLLPGVAGVALIGLRFANTVPVLAMSTFLLGFSLGTEVDFLAFVVRRYFGIKSFGAIYGLLITGYYIGGVIGPVLFGAVFDRASSYSWALRVSAAGLAAAAVAVLTLGPYRYLARAVS